MQVAQAPEETLDNRLVDFLRLDELTQLAGNGRQVLVDTAGFAGQGENSRVLVQQTRAIQVIQGRKQLAQGEVAKGAEQGKGARFNRYRRHDVCSFIKLNDKYLFSRHHSRKKCSNNYNISSKSRLRVVVHNVLPSIAEPRNTHMDRVRNLLEQIQNRLEDLNKAERKVAEVILLNPQQATRYSIAALAQAASVSEPTVNRFCRSFDVSGYPELKLQLAQSLARGVCQPCGGGR